MPCNSDHMEPRADEKASREVAGHLVYVLGKLGEPIPAATKQASEYIYGDTVNLNLFTNQLCRLIRNMSEVQVEDIIYNARSKEARSLADWWEAHQEHDRQREELERVSAERNALKRQALAKLTQEEMDALGINPNHI